MKYPLTRIRPEGKMMNFYGMKRLILLAIACSMFLISVAQKKGIGITFRADSSAKGFAVLRVLKGNAADLAGMLDGDKLLEINGQPLWGRSTDAVADLLANTPGPYTLKLRRDKETSFSVTSETVTLSISAQVLNTRTCISGDCNNGFGKLKELVSNQLYEGDFVNGELVKGRVYYTSGRVRFEGTFKNEKLDGPNCKFYWNRDGSEALAAMGTFKDGIIANGRYWSENGKVFLSGTFDEKGKLHGKHVVQQVDKVKYEGEMAHGEMVGDAKDYSWQQGNYSGPLQVGKPHGKGTWYYQGRRYKGKWVDGKKQGEFKVREKTAYGSYNHVYFFDNDVQR